MSSTPPAVSGPRLVKAGGEPPSVDPVPPDRRIGWLLPLAIAAALVAAGGWGLEGRRAAALTEQVAELEGRIRTQQAEIQARQDHLESLRSAAAAVDEQVSALRLLVDRDPTARVPAPNPADPR